MLSLRALLFAVFGAAGVSFTGFVGSRARARRGQDPGAAADPAARIGWPSPLQMGIGLVTNFFDALGIGSFATTTSLFKLARMVPDGLIPGTMMVGHAWPTIA